MNALQGTDRYLFKTYIVYFDHHLGAATLNAGQDQSKTLQNTAYFESKLNE